MHDDPATVAEQLAHERDQLRAISARITALGPVRSEEGVAEALWFVRSAAVLLGVVAADLGWREDEDVRRESIGVCQKQ